MKNFLEKDLETIIWDNYERCEAKGLAIDQSYYKLGKRYRQLNLAPYGIADLVCIRFHPLKNIYYVQVIELKREKIDASAYMQAKRYLAAIINVLLKWKSDTGANYEIIGQVVLIGTQIETTGDFVFCLHADNACKTFTYSYGFDGIAFTQAGRKWEMNGTKESAALATLERDLMEHESEEYDWKWAHIAATEAELATVIQQSGDDRKALLITENGVLVNEALLSFEMVSNEGVDEE